MRAEGAQAALARAWPSLAAAGSPDRREPASLRCVRRRVREGERWPTRAEASVGRRRARRVSQSDRAASERPLGSLDLIDVDRDALLLWRRRRRRRDLRLRLRVRRREVVVHGGRWGLHDLLLLLAFASLAAADNAREIVGGEGGQHVHAFSAADVPRDLPFRSAYLANWQV